jgi:Flp pilus assembly protein TadD
VDFALRNDFTADEVVPMLEALARAEPAGTASWVFAQQKLAEVLVESDPWRAAIAARAAMAHAPDDEAPRALLGLALTLLGHYRSAARAYRAALSIAPDNPWYAHNLGHLLDVALDQPREAVTLLTRAHLTESHLEIAASLAHALGRIGRTDQARKVLTRALGEAAPNAEHAALLAWLDRGAPESGAVKPHRRAELK